MMRAEPWQTAEVCGPKKAQSLEKPVVVKALLKKAKYPLLVVGANSLTEQTRKKSMIDYFIEFSENWNIPIVATAQTIKAFKEKEFKNVYSHNAMEITYLLTDPEWMVAPKKGPHDLVMTFGFPYYMEWLMLSALVNFSTEMKTVSLGRYFQPHASWSFPNLKKQKWNDALKEILTKNGGKK
ncbi:MAG: CO dehydrogenase/acetyl-CoA synthase complex subunit epsilon [Candidatus Odinarchaeota archaeon]